MKRQTVSLYIKDKHTNYEPPGPLLCALLGTQRGQAQQQIRSAVAGLCESLQLDPSYTLADLCARFNMPMAAVVSFALAFAAGKRAARSKAIWIDPAVLFAADESALEPGDPVVQK